MEKYISRRDFIKTAGAASFMAAAMAVYAKSASNFSGISFTSRPNVVLVLTDDQGYGDLSCHGNPVLKTPNLDKLYAESTHFTDYHVAPMCTPTRGELLTGRQAFRNGAVFVCQGKSMIRRGIPTLADMFRAGGYATGHFGKWHLGDNNPYRPQDRGFDETVHHGAWGITSMADYWDNDYFDDTYEHNGKLKKYKGYCTDVWFDEAMKWMSNQQKKKQPFFCYLPTNVPHWPDLVDQKYKDMYPGRCAGFFGMIAQFDENMGRIEKFMQESGLKENTIFIFMTDNGTRIGNPVFNAGMRGHKTQYYEGGHRVPFFLRWPAAGLDKPRDINELTHSTDVLPTLLDLCGLEKPADVQFDGMSLASLIDGTKDKLPDRKLVIQYNKFNRPGVVLWKKWRLVHGKELYNLADDPGQKNNVIQKYPDVAAQLKLHYARWIEEMTPLQKQVNTISIGVDSEPTTMLCSANWIGSYADSWQNLLNHENLQKRGIKNGYWDLQVEKSGKYEIALYGWPKQTDAAFGDKFTGFTHVPGRQVAGARLKIGEKELIMKTAPTEMCAVFTLSLKKGDKPRLQSWLYDKNSKDLGGSYFVYITKL
ncbi:MAG: arylsulfatase [Planctomycetota bacterium]